MNSPKLMTKEIDKTLDGFSRVFKENLKDVSNSYMLSNDKSSTPRGLKVKEKIFGQMTINPLRPIADFQARPFNWK